AILSTTLNLKPQLNLPVYSDNAAKKLSISSEAIITHLNDIPEDKYDSEDENENPNPEAIIKTLNQRELNSCFIAWSRKEENKHLRKYLLENMKCDPILELEYTKIKKL